MKVSLVIPCTPEHLTGLSDVLKHYSNGTVKPDEVVVSLSNAQLAPDDLKLKTKSEMSDLFDSFILLEHQKMMAHGPNRQAASLASTGELLIYTDADDVAHPKRVETIKFFFENFDIVHLNHWWCREDATFTDFDLEEVEFVLPEQISDYYFADCSLHNVAHQKPGGYGQPFGRTTAGATSIRRTVLEKIRWKDWSELFGPAEDWQFCLEIAHEFRKSMILKIDLIKYVSECTWTFPQEVYNDDSPAAKHKQERS